MKFGYWLLVIGLCACVATPTPTAPVTLYVTDATAALAHDLIGAYRTVNPAAEIWTEETAAPTGAVTLMLSAPAGKYATPLGYARFVVGVNMANSVGVLSASDVRAIYTGQTLRWSDPAAANVITLVGREGQSDAGQTFEREMLLGASPSPNMRVVAEWSALREVIQSDVNAIGYLPSYSADGVKVVASWRAMVVAVSEAEPQGVLRDFVAWAQSADGQKVVAERYEALK